MKEDMRARRRAMMSWLGVFLAASVAGGVVPCRVTDVTLAHSGAVSQLSALLSMESSRRRALRAGVLEWAVDRGAPCGSVVGGWRMAAGVLVLRGGAAERQDRGDNEDTDKDTMQYAEAKQWAKRQMSELEDRKKHLKKELFEEEYGDDEPDPDAKAANISRSERMNNSLAEHGANYTEMMLRFGVTKEYLAKVKGDDEEKEAIHNASLKSKFVTGARHPQWMQDLEEMGRNGTWAHLCPLPATALPYAQPTGLWRPHTGCLPSDPRFAHAGCEADDYSEAALSGFAPHNYVGHRPHGGISTTYPSVWYQEICDAADSGEQWAIDLQKAGNETDKYPDTPENLRFRQRAFSGRFESGSEVRAAAALGQQWALEMQAELEQQALQEEQDREHKKQNAAAAFLRPPSPQSSCSSTHAARSHLGADYDQTVEMET